MWLMYIYHIGYMPSQHMGNSRRKREKMVLKKHLDGNRKLHLPNLTKLSENSKIPLKPRFCVLAARGSVQKVTSSRSSLEYSTRFRCWPQYVPITADVLSGPSYTRTQSNGQLSINVLTRQYTRCTRVIDLLLGTFLDIKASLCRCASRTHFFFHVSNDCIFVLALEPSHVQTVNRLLFKTTII